MIPNIFSFYPYLCCVLLNVVIRKQHWTIPYLNNHNVSHLFKTTKNFNDHNFTEVFKIQQK